MRGSELGYPVSPATARPLLRVAVVNDFEIVVQGVATMLADYPARVVVVELSSRMPVLSGVDIILCDTFGGVAGDGVDLADLLGSDAKVVVYTWSTDPASMKWALSQGAAGYLSKGLAVPELIGALERIHRGEVVTRIGDQENVNGHAAWPGQHAGLSQREAEVLGFIAKGLSNQEIADISYLSINTVKTYIRTAYAKIGVTRRPDAVIWALRNGFAPEARREVMRG